MPMQQTQLLELYRANLRATADVMRAQLENAERMQNQQIEGVRRAIEENTRSARELTEAKSIDELMGLQIRLTGAQLERTMDFWSRIWRTAAETQMSMLGQFQSQIGQMGDRVRETYAFTARSAEDATRFAASQAATASAGVRDTAAQMAASQERKQEQHPQRKSA
jgi:hypothetical protein